MDFVINKNELLEILKDFYTLTKIRIVVFDDKYSEILSYPNHHSTYCKILRQCPEAENKCMLCDIEACSKSKSNKKTVVYKCYAGLYEAVTPIEYENIVIGYIMFGQILQTENKEKSWQEVYPKISDFSVDIAALKNAYFKKKSFTEDTINAASKILQACSGYLYLSKIISVRNESIEKRIEKYITSNLSQPLRVETICNEFLISKTHLHEISKYCFGTGISEHIKNLRIEKAKNLLKSTDKSINEIAALCGIPDYNYFTKVFKSATNETPSKYRKNNKISSRI